MNSLRWKVDKVVMIVCDGRFWKSTITCITCDATHLAPKSAQKGRSIAHNTLMLPSKCEIGNSWTSLTRILAVSAANVSGVRVDMCVTTDIRRPNIRITISCVNRRGESLLWYFSISWRFSGVNYLFLSVKSRGTWNNEPVKTATLIRACWEIHGDIGGMIMKYVMSLFNKDNKKNKNKFKWSYIRYTIIQPQHKLKRVEQV